APRRARRPAGKARRPRIPGVFEGGATQPAGMRRPANAAGRLPRAARTTVMKIALLQINPTVGDLAGNARLIADAVRQVGHDGADLAVTPELALVGYL